MSAIAFSTEQIAAALSALSARKGEGAPAEWHGFAGSTCKLCAATLTLHPEGKMRNVHGKMKLLKKCPNGCGSCRNPLEAIAASLKGHKAPAPVVDEEAALIAAIAAKKAADPAKAARIAALKAELAALGQ